MEKKRVYVTNFATFASHDGGGRYRIIKNESGEETGIEVGGLLTTFDVRNENGGNFKRDSYDKFVDDYFIKNSLNVPLCLYHNDWDIRMVCGVVKSLTKTEEGVEMVGFIPKTAYFYNLIKAQIDAGILQGFSNAGGITEAEYDPETDTLNITDFALMHAALVAQPADTGAKFKAVNTIFRGFGCDPESNSITEEKKEETKGPEADALEDWRLLA